MLRHEATVWWRTRDGVRSSHGPETVVARPRDGRCTSRVRWQGLGMEQSIVAHFGAQHCSSLCSQSEGREYCGDQTRLIIQRSHVPGALNIFATCSSPSLCKQSELQCWRRKVINTVGAPVREVLIEYYHKLDRNNSGCAILRILHIRLTLFYRRFFSSSIIRPSSE